jgi:hypothetical protein
MIRQQFKLRTIASYGLGLAVWKRKQGRKTIKHDSSSISMSGHSQHGQSYKNTKIMISCTSPKKAVIVYLGTESREGGNKQRKLKSMDEGGVH